MAQTLEEWLKTDVKKASKFSIGKMSNEYFFRDPARPCYIDNDYFYSPADGVIMYQKTVNPNQPVVEIKGVNYTLKDVMCDEGYNTPSLVIGIFMTFYDVHINRIPYSGVLSYERVPCIESTNRPMLAVEKDILNKVINPNNMDYLKYNERVINKIYNPQLDYTYYLIQIADEDVDVITHFNDEQNTPLSQNSRFSLVRWGSQVDLVLPLTSKLDFEILIPDTYHVNAGLDKLIKVTKHYDRLQ